MPLPALLNFPDGDFAVAPGGAAQDVAILDGAEGLDAVRVGLQLLGHSVALWVHHQHLASLLTVTLASDTSPAATAHPYLSRGGDRGKTRQVKLCYDWRTTAVSKMTYFCTQHLIL